MIYLWKFRATKTKAGKRQTDREGENTHENKWRERKKRIELVFIFFTKFLFANVVIIESKQQKKKEWKCFLETSFNNDATSKQADSALISQIVKGGILSFIYQQDAFKLLNDILFTLTLRWETW